MNNVNSQLDAFHSVGNFLKEDCPFEEWIEKSIPIVDQDGKQFGFLAPVARHHLEDEELISAFVRWRDAHQYAFSSRFDVTFESTLSWVENQVVNNKGRILFLVLDLDFQAVGRLGLLETSNDSFRLEVDNVLRGESGAPGILGRAMSAMEKWAATTFFVTTLQLKVLDSNSRAVSFYAKNNWNEVSRESMKWTSSDQIRFLTPGVPADEYLVTMEKLLST